MRAFALFVLLALPCFADEEVGPFTRGDQVQLTILQLNDVYQTGAGGDGRGGMARVATLRQSLLMNQPDSLFLFAGDTLSPSVASILFRGKQMIAAWNAVGLDYATFGNHEFDFGPQVLQERIAESKFKWIASNVIDRRTAKPFGGALEYAIHEVRGVKVGIFGVLTPETMLTSHPGKDIEIRDPCDTAKQVVPKLRAAGAQVIVGLTHLSMADDRALAACVPIDVIVGGHDHVLIQSYANGTPIFRCGSDAKYLGKIDVAFSPSHRRVEATDFELIPVSTRVPEDPATAKAVLEYEVLLSKELDQVIARSLVELDAVQSNNQSRETNLGSFIADVFRQAGHAQIAILNGGTIRSNTTYGPGDLRKRDVLSILPFENSITTLRMTGAQVIQALEHGVGLVGTKTDGRFPQVSGLRFEYDARREPGKRVLSVKVVGSHPDDPWVPIDPAHDYSVATNAYLAHGGDGYAILKQAHRLVRPESGPAESAAVYGALLKMGTIAPLIRGRVVRADTP